MKDRLLNVRAIAGIWLAFGMVSLGIFLFAFTGCSESDDQLSSSDGNDWQYETVSGSNIRLTGCHTDKKEIVIPDTLDNMPVTVIGSSAFVGLSPESVTLPDHVKVIESQAFLNCQSLRDINLSSVETIGKEAFSGCRLLARAELGESLNTLGESAFDGCEALEEIILPSSLTELPEHVFSNCYNLKSINLPEGLTKIGACAFSDCISLNGPDMPASLQSVGEFAFMGCQSIETAEISGAEFQRGVWMDCRRLKQITFSGEKIKLSDYLFAGCVSLSELSIPSNVISIGESSFRYCTGLKRIEMPVSVSHIGRNAFSDCGSPVIAAPQTSAANRYAIAFGFKYENTTP